MKIFITILIKELMNCYLYSRFKLNWRKIRLQSLLKVHCCGNIFFSFLSHSLFLCIVLECSNGIIILCTSLKCRNNFVHVIVKCGVYVLLLNYVPTSFLINCSLFGQSSFRKNVLSNYHSKTKNLYVQSIPLSDPTIPTEERAVAMTKTLSSIQPDHEVTISNVE